MGDFLSSVLPPGLIDVLSALIPPVVVGATFCFFIIKLLRKEMAPRRMDGSPAGNADTAEETGSDNGERGVEEDGAANETPIAQSGEQTESDGR